MKNILNNDNVNVLFILIIMVDDVPIVMFCSHRYYISIKGYRSRLSN